MVKLNKLVLLLLVPFAATTGLGQQKSANDPVPELARQRFTFQLAGHSFTLPCDSNVDMQKSSSTVKHAVFMVPGYLRQRHYHDVIVDALEAGGATEGVAVISPQFLNKADVTAYKLDSSYPYWSNGGWAIGDNSLPANAPLTERVSSFTVMDELILDAIRRYPKLETITVAGFSAGGQYLNRYAAGNQVNDRIEDQGISLTYIVASPSSYLYFDQRRAVSPEPLIFGSIADTAYADCADYNTYRYGLDKLNLYMRKAGSEKIPGQYADRHIVHMVGEKDDASASAHLAKSCAAMLQGEHRLDRAIIYYDYLQDLFGDKVANNHSLVIVAGVGHNSRGMFLSPEGVEILFESLH